MRVNVWILIGGIGALLGVAAVGLGLSVWYRSPSRFVQDAVINAVEAPLEIHLAVSDSATRIRGEAVGETFQLEVSDVRLSGATTLLTGQVIRIGDTTYVRSENIDAQFMEMFVDASLKPYANYLRPVAASVNGKWVRLAAGELPAGNDAVGVAACMLDFWQTLRTDAAARREFAAAYREVPLLDIQAVESSESSVTAQVRVRESQGRRFYDRLARTDFYQRLAKCNKSTFLLSHESAEGWVVDMTVDKRTRQFTSLAFRREGDAKTEVTVQVRPTGSAAVQPPSGAVDFQSLRSQVMQRMLSRGSAADL